MKLINKLLFISILIVVGILNVNASESEEIYIKTVTQYNVVGQVVGAFDMELTKEEMDVELLEAEDDDSSIANTYCIVNGRSIPCYETTYKKLTLIYNKSDTNKYEVEAELKWLSTPLITKYDIFALRWNGTGTLVTASGVQKATGKSNVNYPYGDDNMLIFSNGIGITMNMYDNTSGHEMHLYATFSGSPLAVYVTYQHARHSNITFAMSQSYTISSNGLGAVLYFSNTTTRGYYDGMKGLHDVTPTQTY